MPATTIPLSSGHQGVSSRSHATKFRITASGGLTDEDIEKMVADAELNAEADAKFADLISKINESGALDDEITAGMTSAIEDFKANGAY